MAYHKEKPKYHVISMRVDDLEKTMLEEMTRHARMSMSKLMREAIRCYVPHLKG